MAYGKIKADAIIRDNSGSDEEISMATIVGLDTAKAPKASPTFTGTVTMPATVAFAGQASDITLDDNQAAALEVKQGTNNYITFDTTDGSEQIEIAKKVELANHLEFSAAKDILIPDNQANALDIAEGTNNYVTFDTTDSNEQIEVAKKVVLANHLEFSTAKDVLIPDNDAAALEIKEGTNAYMTFITTNSGEKVVANKNFQADVTLTDASDLSSGTTLDLSSKNFFHRQVNGNVTYTFSNPPASGTVVGFTLEVDYESGTITWPASVEWVTDTVPALTAAHTSVFVFYTRDNGSTYRGASLVDFDD